MLPLRSLLLLHPLTSRCRILPQKDLPTGTPMGLLAERRSMRSVAQPSPERRPS